MSVDRFLASVSAAVRRHDEAFRSTVHVFPSPAPALAAYPTTTALLEALRPRSALSVLQRQPLVHALLELHHRHPHTLWPTLLAAACEPLLRALEMRLRGCPRDAGQRVLLAFLQALDRENPRGQPVFVALRRTTARLLFGRAKGEPRPERHVPFDETSPRLAVRADLDAAPFLRCLLGEIASIAEQLGE
jgi:hypothetical protein